MKNKKTRRRILMNLNKNFIEKDGSKRTKVTIRFELNQIMDPILHRVESFLRIGVWNFSINFRAYEINKTATARFNPFFLRRCSETRIERRKKIFKLQNYNSHR